MQAVTYNEFKSDPEAVMDGVCRDREPVIIAREHSDNLVLISYDDYAAFEETAYLLRSPENAKRLRESIRSFHEGKGEEKELIEVED